jgi:hypothetical protein
MGAYGMGVSTTTASASINNQFISGTTSSGWSHVALTYDRSNMKLYVNGIEKASRGYSAAISTNTNNLLMGDSIAFKGYLDEVRISGVKREASWISTEFRNEVNPALFHYNMTQEAWTC